MFEKSFGQLGKLLKETGNSLVVAIRGSRVTRRGCTSDGFALDSALQIVENRDSKDYSVFGLQDSDGALAIELDGQTSLKQALENGVNEWRKQRASAPKELSSYAIYLRTSKCNKPAALVEDKALEQQATVGKLLGEEAAKPTAFGKALTQNDIGQRMVDLQKLFNGHGKNQLVVTVRSNLPQNGPPTCDFEVSGPSSKLINVNRRYNALILANKLREAAFAIQEKTGASDTDIVVFLKPGERCKNTSLASGSELDFVEPLASLLKSDLALDKRQIRLAPIASQEQVNKGAESGGNGAKNKAKANNKEPEENQTLPNKERVENNEKPEQPESKPKEEKEEEKQNDKNKIVIFAIVGAVLLAIVVVLIVLISKGRQSQDLEPISAFSYNPNVPLPPPIARY